ncbi:MAG: hypothetical protein KC478_16285 [Bacteriovoracaceae bacterium]|nr:hypothetical protein [Bacteriovoracaceae bacterium]
MKYFLLTVFLIGLSNIVYGGELSRNTTISFMQEIELKDGQKSFKVANGKCTFHLEKEAFGPQVIEFGTMLAITRIQNRDGHFTVNPATGESILVHPTKRIDLYNTKSYILCRGGSALSIGKKELESDGTLGVQLTDFTPYKF